MKLEEERDYPPLSPGAVLQERIAGRLGMSQAALAKALGVSRFTVNQVLDGRRAVSAEMALRLGHVLIPQTGRCEKCILSRFF